MILLLAAWCAGLAGGAALLAPAAGPSLLAGALVAAGAAAVARALTRPGPRAAACLLAPALLLGGAARGAAAVHVPSPASIDYYYGQHASLVGIVTRSSGGSTFQSFWLSSLHMAGSSLGGTIQVTSRSPVAVVPGSTVRVSGSIERVPGRAYDGSTGFDDRMEREGVLAAMPSATFVAVSPAAWWSVPAMGWRLRAGIATGLRARVPEPEATVLMGELVGIRGKLPAQVEADLVDSGLVHVLAVSGLKVAIVAGILAALLRQAGRRAALLAIAGVFAYAVVGGASSAAVRSAVMGSLALVAQVIRRDTDPPRSLLLAASLMLGMNPELASDLSFQYSFLGVAGIQVLLPALDRRFGFVPRPFREALTVSLAAQLATVPLTASYFHVVPVLGPAVNTVVVPFLGPTMLAAAWVAGGLPGAGGLALFLAAGLAHAVVVLAHLGATTPAGVWRVPWFGLPEALAYYAGAAALVAAARFRRHGRRLLVAAPAMAVGVGLVLSLPDGRMHLQFLDTPGGGVMVTAPDGARMLVDSGSSPAGLAAALDTLLPPASARLDAVMLTGSGAGAAGGVAGLGSRVPGLFLFPADTSGDIPLLVAGALSGHGASTRSLAPGDELRWHGVDLAISTCGDGLSVTISYGATDAWVCDSGTAYDPGIMPAGRVWALDVGLARFEPDGGLDPGAWVVEHGSRATPGALSAVSLGPRLWRTSRDGPLALACDRQSCTR